MKFCVFVSLSDYEVTRSYSFGILVETMAAASETSKRITKFYKNAQLQKWTTFVVVKCAEVKVLVEINVYFEVDGMLRYFFVIVWNSSWITTIWNNLKYRLFNVTILNMLTGAI